MGQLRPLSAALSVACSNATLKPENLDLATVNIGHLIMGASRLRTGSQVAFAESSGVSRDILLPRQKSLVASVYVACRQARWDLESTLQPQLGKPVEFVAYIDTSRYDETPMKVMAAGPSSIAVRSPFTQSLDPAQRSLAASASGAVGTWNPFVGEHAVTLSASSKLLQTEKGFGFLVRCGETFFGVVGSTLCHLQLFCEMPRRSPRGTFVHDPCVPKV